MLPSFPTPVDPAHTDPAHADIAHADIAHVDIAHADIANEPQQPRAAIPHQVTTLFTLNYSNRKLIHTVHGVATFSYDSDTMPHRRNAATQNRTRHYGTRQIEENRRAG
jgi:hypothetical protein